MNLEKFKAEGAIARLREEIIAALQRATEAMKYCRYEDAVKELADANEVLIEHNRFYKEAAEKKVIM